MMNEKIKKFIEENIELIENDEWEEIYRKLFLDYSVKYIGQFTDILLDCGINPLTLSLNYIPDGFLTNSAIEEFTIPDSITYIDAGAFRNCRNLTSITIPNSVTSIGFSAFNNCSSLTNVTIGNSVTNISYGAFRDCTNLTNIEIPDSVTSIDYEAFIYCSKLTHVTIPNSVTSIGDYAFYNCSSLTSIKYLGTKKEALTKLKVRNKRWREGSGIKKIICTDGDIEL